ncbi:hypothetical protein ACTSKR_08040 [Chitinibacteraceae bacterium HSL-7]
MCQRGQRDLMGCVEFFDEARSLKQLQDSLSSYQRIYLLIDPAVNDVAQVDSLGGQIDAQRSAFWQRPVQQVVLDQRIPLPAQRHPYLVELDGPNDHWIEFAHTLAIDEVRDAQTGGLHSDGQGIRSVGGWIDSPHDGEQLADSLARMMLLPASLARFGSYLRLADLRVRAWVAMLIGAQRMPLNRYAIRNWCGIDDYGHCHTLHASDAQVSPLQRPFVFTLDEMQQLLEAPIVHSAIARGIGQMTEEDRIPVSLPASYAELLAQLHAACSKPAGSLHRNRVARLIQTSADRSAELALDLLCPGWDHPDLLARAQQQSDSHTTLSELAPYIYHCTHGVPEQV